MKIPSGCLTSRSSAIGNSTLRTGRIAAFVLGGIEVVWHGKDVGLSPNLQLPDGTTYGNVDPNWGVSRAQRIQGFVGIDTNGDEAFNYTRSVQTVSDFDGDPDTIRLGDVTRRLDFTDTNGNGIYEPESWRCQQSRTAGRKHRRRGVPH